MVSHRPWKAEASAGDLHGAILRSTILAEPADIMQKTEFRVEGDKLVAKTDRTITPRGKPERVETFDTVSHGARSRIFAAKNSSKLELGDID